MTKRPLDDAFLEATLRAHVPAAAPAGLRDRILVTAGETRQARRPLRLFGRFADPSRPVVERRLLVAAALVTLLLALVAAMAIGQRLLRPPGPEQILERAWGAMADPPAFQMDVVSGTGRVYRVLSDGAGRIRFETSATDDPAFTDWYYVAKPGRLGRGDVSMQLWSESARSEAPALAEVWLPSTLTAWFAGASGRDWPPSPTCDWADADPTTVAGRPATRLACPDLSIDIDDETGLPLAGTWAGDDGVRTTLTATGINFTTPSADFTLGPKSADIMVLTEPPPAPSAGAPLDGNRLVQDAIDALPHLPPFRAVIRDSQASQERWTHDGAGTVRSDHFGNRMDTTPSESMISDPTSQVRREGSGWVRYTDQGDPRAEFGRSLGGCPGGWSYVGEAIVAGRQAHNVEGCGHALWIDDETLFVLRSDDGYTLGASPGPGLDQRVILETVEFEVGPQPAELFDIDRLTGGAEVISQSEAQCRMDPSCASPAPSAPPVAIEPLPDPPAIAAPVGAMTDPDAVVMQAADLAKTVPDLAVTIREQVLAGPDGMSGGDSDTENRVWQASGGNQRLEYDWDLHDANNTPTVFLTIDRVSYESYAQDDGSVVWKQYPPSDGSDASGFWTRGIERPCSDGRRHLGFASIVDRPTHVIGCGEDRWWVDVETGMVLRTDIQPTFLAPDRRIYAVSELEFGPQPHDRFVLPPGDRVTTGRP